ncbi:hypothetical protein F5878DRAFT_430455 [Lentinula raphanica]|uniref:Uncharacterized protein n=1 Tax=Lentinula raphanica TaxID=153919 RepID=A0AA38NYI1_9AGAR|nr:hypothetical protein F5878DRAFT_430455 [Lentinula raphanica]
MVLECHSPGHDLAVSRHVLALTLASASLLSMHFGQGHFRTNLGWASSVIHWLRSSVLLVIAFSWLSKAHS